MRAYSADGATVAMDIDIPDVRAEVEAAFARYEVAILANDVP